MYMYISSARASSSAYEALIKDVSLHSSIDQTISANLFASILICEYNHCHIDRAPKRLTRIWFQFGLALCVCDSVSICLLACVNF